jgi:hypothetical protein
VAVAVAVATVVGGDVAACGPEEGGDEGGAIVPPRSCFGSSEGAAVDDVDSAESSVMTERGCGIFFDDANKYIELCIWMARGYLRVRRILFYGFIVIKLVRMEKELGTS